MAAYRVVSCQRFGSALPAYSIVEASFEDDRLNRWWTEIAVPWEMAECVMEALGALPRRPSKPKRIFQIQPLDPFYGGMPPEDLYRDSTDFGKIDCSLPSILQEIDEWQRRETD